MRILDLSQEAAGPFATLLLAELGADVIKVEPPAGDPWRSRDARADGEAGFGFLNRRKRSAMIDYTTRPGRELVLRLAARADAVVENFAPGELARLRLSYRALRRVHRHVVLTSISNFGQDGPRRDWQATELVLQATAGGLASTGFDEQPPAMLPGYQASYIAGLNAATATLAGVYGVQAGTERGCHIDVPIQETLTAHWSRHVSEYVYGGRGMRRETRASGRQGFPHTARASDGYLFLLALFAEWEELAHFLGLEQFVTHEWHDPVTRVQRWDEVEPAFNAAIASRSKYAWFDAASARGYTFAPVEDAHDVLASPQAEARGFYQPAWLEDGSETRCAGLPFSFGGARRPNRVPRLGEHTAEVLAELLAAEASEPETPHAAGPI